MSSKPGKIKKKYSKWLFLTEVLMISWIYLIILLGPLNEYFFYVILYNYNVFIYVFLYTTLLAFIFFLITLATGTYYKQQQEAYNSYKKKIHALKKRGHYCPKLKYTISIVVVFLILIPISVLSAIKALDSLSVIYILIAILLILSLFGFKKVVFSSLFYSLLSKKRVRRRKKEVELNPVEDTMDSK